MRRELTCLTALPFASAAFVLPAAPSAQAADRAAAVIREINEQRAANGLAPVRRNRSLAALARGHSAHMVERREFSHGDFSERIRRSSWARRRGTWAAGETLAWGTGRRGTPAGVVEAWMQSPEHRRIVLDPRFHVVGVGQVKGVPVHGTHGRGGRTYTADFGS
jgi:uncharacterized protein YkwD